MSSPRASSCAREAAPWLRGRRVRGPPRQLELFDDLGECSQLVPESDEEGRLGVNAPGRLKC